VQQLRTPAARKSRCGIKPPKVLVGGPKPTVATLPPLTDGGAPVQGVSSHRCTGAFTP